MGCITQCDATFLLVRKWKLLLSVVYYGFHTHNVPQQQKQQIGNAAPLSHQVTSRQASITRPVWMRGASLLGRHILHCSGYMNSPEQVVLHVAEKFPELLPTQRLPRRHL